ncbi:MAG: response regulator transcription factor, partial [Phycisphaeraceae bacterium]
MHSDLIDKLTSREREILTHIGEGESLAVIAKKLCRSLKTIESHRLSIGRKLKANNRVELAKIAIASGLVVLDGQQVKPGKTEPTRAQEWIGIINKAIHQATGRQLLERFCITASSLQGVDIAAICTCDPTQMAETCDVYNRVIMAVSDNGKLAKAMRYNAAQTPCQAVIGQGSLMMARGISDHYPN